MKPITWCHSISSALMISQLTSALNLASNYLGCMMTWSTKSSLALKKKAVYRPDKRSLVAMQSQSRETSECHLVMEVPYLFKIVNSINFGSLYFCAFLFIYFFYLSPFLVFFLFRCIFLLRYMYKKAMMLCFQLSIFVFLHVSHLDFHARGHLVME